MTYDPDALAEREAILAEDPTITNPAQQAALQMACAAWGHAPASGLTERQQAWLQVKVLAGSVFTPGELERLTPALVAWVDAQDVRWGQALREALGLAVRPPVERPRDMAFLAGTVREGALDAD